MSYSFSIQAATKTEASEKVREELDKVVASQPIHAADYPRAWAAADTFISLLRDDQDRDVAVSVNGSCSGVEGALDSASVNVSAALVARAQS